MSKPLLGNKPVTISNYENVKQNMSPAEISAAQKKGTLIYFPIMVEGKAIASDTEYDLIGGTWVRIGNKKQQKKLRKAAIKAQKKERLEAQQI